MLNNELNFRMGLKCKVMGDEILICVDMKIHEVCVDIHEVCVDMKILFKHIR